MFQVEIKAVSLFQMSLDLRERVVREMRGSRHQTPVPWRCKDLARDLFRIAREAHHHVRHQLARLRQLIGVTRVKIKMRAAWLQLQNIAAHVMAQLVHETGQGYNRRMRRVDEN